MDFKELMEISRGFWKSSILFAGIRLKIFDAVEGEGKDLERIVGELKIDRRGGEILLNALTAIGLLEKAGNVYRNREAASLYLVERSPDYRGNIFMHSLGMWRAWGDLETAVRTGKPLESYEERFLHHNRERVQDFILGMDQIGRETAELLAGHEDVKKATRMLDVGGGPGTYCRCFIQANPGLKATILDLPLTLEVTKGLVKEWGMEGKISTMEGDLLEQDFGTGYDLILLSQILHSFSAEQNRKIIGKAHRALLPGGTLMVNEFALNEDKTSPRDAALFAVNMLVNTEEGAAYSIQEIRSWLEEAGFRNISSRRLLERVTHFTATK